MPSRIEVATVKLPQPVPSANGLLGRGVGWLIVKDLWIEARTRRAWPSMLLLGLQLVLLFELQLELPAEHKLPVACGLLWLGVYFAGTLSLEGSFAQEREAGCWRALRLYPIPSAALFVAKLTVNFLALAALECLLIPAFVVLGNVPLLDRPLELALIAVLGNVGFGAVGVLVSALTAGSSARHGHLALLVLPLTAPVILGSAAATRALLAQGLDESCRHWLGLLAGFAVIYVTLGILLFPAAIED